MKTPVKIPAGLEGVERWGIFIGISENNLTSYGDGTMLCLIKSWAGFFFYRPNFYALRMCRHEVGSLILVERGGLKAKSCKGCADLCGMLVKAKAKPEIEKASCLHPQYTFRQGVGTPHLLRTWINQS